MMQRNNKANRGDHIDRISGLPSLAIVGILKNLHVTDLVRTSILSRKWRHMWASVPRLEFGCEFFWKCKHLDIPRIITQVLFLHNNGPVHEFALHNPVIPLDYPIQFACLDKWILFLSSNGVKHLELVLGQIDQSYKMPSHLFSCHELVYLRLHGFKFSLPTNFCGFKSLTELHLSQIRFESNALRSLISGCPLLNVLILSYCSGFGIIDVPAPGLKVLRIEACQVIRSICLQKAENLTDLTLLVSNPGGNFENGRIIQGLLKLERLRLGEGYIKILSVGTVPQTLRRSINSLKYLELSGVNFNLSREFLFTICLLSSSPNLVELVIKSRFRGGGPAPEHLKELECNSCCLSQLKTVNINVDTDYKHAVKLIRFLLSNSSSLEILIFKVGLGLGLKPLDTLQMLNIAQDLLEMGRASQKAEVKFLYDGLTE